MEPFWVRLGRHSLSSIQTPTRRLFTGARLSRESTGVCLPQPTGDWRTRCCIDGGGARAPTLPRIDAAASLSGRQQHQHTACVPGLGIASSSPESPPSCASPHPSFGLPPSPAVRLAALVWRNCWGGDGASPSSGPTLSADDRATSYSHPAGWTRMPSGVRLSLIDSCGYWLWAMFPLSSSVLRAKTRPPGH